MLQLYRLLAFFGLIVLTSTKASDDVTCRDQDNNPVDWFYLYKLPKNKFTTNPLIKKGLAYMYITPNTIRRGWTLSDKSINDTQSIPGRTLNVLYKSSKQLFSTIYNDQPPDKVIVEPPKNGILSSIWNYFRNAMKKSVVNVEEKSSPDSKANKKKKRKSKNAGGGHTKGVIISNNRNGIWLIHSVPKFPPLPGEKIIYSYPSNAERYGQSFLCLSLPSSVMDTVGVQLSYNEPNIVFSNVPDQFKNLFKSIVNVINNETVSNSPWENVARLTTNKGEVFQSFAKSANFNNDLYYGLIAQNLETDLLVESWINGPGVLQSNCSYKYKVNNIEKIAFHDENIAFSSHSDHSKWAISVPPKSSRKKSQNDKYWVCVGDINRAETQEHRGGGSVCISNSDLWKIYSDSVNSIEPCGSSKN